MTHAHTHTHDDGAAAAAIAPSRRRTLFWSAATIAVAILLSMVVLWPSSGFGDGLGQLGMGSEFYRARVLDIGVAPCAGTQPEDEIDCQDIALELLEGPDEGGLANLNFGSDGTTTPEFDIGDEIVVARQADAEPGFEYAYADRYRKPVLAWLALTFAIAVVALGRWRGLAALAGLVVSFVVLLQFILPAILDGRDPLIVAVVGAAAIAYLAIYLAHGVNALTTVALLGTLGALVVTVAFAQLFVSLAEFSGFASDEAIFLNVARGAIDLNGLTLGGIVIGALGAIDDMTVTQAAVVAELRTADPGISPVRLFTSAMRVGRDHVASIVNTLALAYAGASLPLLILFVLARQSLGTVANGEIVATEIVRTIVGSLGLVAAVPLTTWLAVWAVGGRRERRRPVESDPFADD